MLPAHTARASRGCRPCSCTLPAGASREAGEIAGATGGTRCSEQKASVSDGLAKILKLCLGRRELGSGMHLPDAVDEVGLLNMARLQLVPSAFGPVYARLGRRVHQTLDGVDVGRLFRLFERVPWSCVRQSQAPRASRWSIHTMLSAGFERYMFRWRTCHSKNRAERRTTRQQEGRG
jgi:hypothetical protein